MFNFVSADFSGLRSPKNGPGHGHSLCRIDSDKVMTSDSETISNKAVVTWTRPKTSDMCVLEKKTKSTKKGK